MGIEPMGFHLSWLDFSRMSDVVWMLSLKLPEDGFDTVRELTQVNQTNSLVKYRESQY